MNVAIISPSHCSYSETFIQAQIKGLKKFHHVFYYYGGDMPLFLEGHGKMLTLLKKVIFKLKIKLKLTGFSLGEQALLNSFKKNYIQVVLAQYGPTGVKANAVCRTLKIPLVVHFHGYDASKYDVIKTYGNAYIDLFKNASFIIAVSKVMVEDLVRLGCSRAKIIYNPCAPADAFFKVKPLFKKPQFLSVGRFTEKKGSIYTIKAFYEVIKTHPEAKLIMAGEGELLNTCKALAQELKIEKQVCFPGIINQENFIKYLEESIAFVQHSIVASTGDKEGTPVSIMEASASGLPVIATQHAGIPDVILNNKTGLLIEERDIIGMSKHMVTLLDNLPYAKKLGSEGKRWIKTYYSFVKHINTLNDLLLKAN